MKHNQLIATMIILAITLSSCSVIGGIFKAGVWVGVGIVAVIVLIIIWIVSKASGGGK